MGPTPSILKHWHFDICHRHAPVLNTPRNPEGIEQWGRKQYGNTVAASGAPSRDDQNFLSSLTPERFTPAAGPRAALHFRSKVA